MLPHAAETFRNHFSHILRPNVCLDVQENIAIEPLQGLVPLLGEIGVVTDVMPVGMLIPQAVVGIDHEYLAMLAKHLLQLRGVLLFAGPVKNESLQAYALIHTRLRPSVRNVCCGHPSEIGGHSGNCAPSRMRAGKVARIPSLAARPSSIVHPTGRAETVA
jgi:hypothetical protein